MINLLPPLIREERIYGRRNRFTVGYIIALIVTAALVAGIMVGSLRFVGADETSIRQEINDTTATISAINGKVRDIDALVAKLSTVDKLYESGVSFSALIPEIGALLPPGTVLNGLSLTGGKTDPLSLDVDLLRPELASVLVQNLIESELFEAADIGAITSKGEGSYPYGTTITASFTGSAEAKRKEKAAAAAAAAAAAEAQANGGTEQ